MLKYCNSESSINPHPNFQRRFIR